MSEQTKFNSLVESLSNPLPTEKDQVSELREMVAFAESCGVFISGYMRSLKQQLDTEMAEALEELKQDEVYQKSNAEEKKLLLYSKVAEMRARVEYAEKLEDLIKRRCSLGQSFIKSIDLEERTTYNV